MAKSSKAKPLTAAVYARISRDAEGERLGVDRQIEACRALAEQLGYEVIETFVDNDISASTKSRKARPAYNEMMAAGRAGHFAAILAYSNSRLTRRVREYMDLIDLTNQHGVLIKTAVSGQHDLSTADGRGAALTVAVWDQAEAERTAERVAAAKKQAALQGKYRGGPRPFGFEADGVTVREREAALIREATRAVLAGRTLAAVTRDLNQRGSTGTRGKPWTYANLRDMLLRPRNAGLLATGLPGRKGRTQHEPDWSFEADVIGQANWPAIVPEEEWRALVSLLADPSRRTTQNRETRWLGSGIYRCGVPTGEFEEDGTPKVCGAPLRTAPHGGTAAKPYTRRYLYRCTAQAHLTVRADQTDDFVLGVVAGLVRDPRVAAAMQPGNPGLDSDRERRTLLARRLESFERDYALGDITGAQLQKATAAVTAELSDVDARLAKSMRRSASASVLEAVDPGAAFLAAPIDVQRAVLSTVLRVEVVPQERRGTVWTPERLRLTPVA